MRFHVASVASLDQPTLLATHQEVGDEVVKPPTSKMLPVSDQTLDVPERWAPWAWLKCTGAAGICSHHGCDKLVSFLQSGRRQVSDERQLGSSVLRCNAADAPTLPSDGSVSESGCLGSDAQRLHGSPALQEHLGAISV